MALFTKDKKPNAQEVQNTINAHVIMQGRWRRLGDDELPEGLRALAAATSKKEANSPALARRLAILVDRSQYLLTIDLPLTDIIGAVWHAGPLAPQFVVAAFPIAIALEILRADWNPERELADRRRRHQQYLDGERSKADAQTKDIADKQAAQAKEEQERAIFHAGDWRLLNGLERFAVRLALAVEGRDAALAADLRALVAQSLAGADDDVEAWPKNPGWFAGLGLEALSAERRQALALEVVGERENRQLEQIPRDRLPSLKLMAGNDRAAILSHWQQIVRLNRRGASGKAA
jgi:hypothetical protein